MAFASSRQRCRSLRVGLMLSMTTFARVSRQVSNRRFSRVPRPQDVEAQVDMRAQETLDEEGRVWMLKTQFCFFIVDPFRARCCPNHSSCQGLGIQSCNELVLWRGGSLFGSR